MASKKHKKAQPGGAGNPKSEIRDPKQIRIIGNGRNGKTKTKEFAIYDEIDSLIGGTERPAPCAHDLESELVLVEAFTVLFP